MKRLFLVGLLLFCVSALCQSQTITVLSPNGGENWALGSSQTISWSPTGVTGNVNIILFNGAQRVGTIANNVPVTTGSYRWVVGSYQGGTAAPGTNYKVRVRKPQTEIMDDSNRPFTISGGAPRSATISVTSPNGGETWYTNAAHEVRWTSDGVSGKVTIRVKKGGAVVRSWTAENTGSSYGSYSWAEPGTDYKIRVESSDGAAFDESDRNFSIQALPGPTPPPTPSGQIRQPEQIEGTIKMAPKIMSFRLNNGADVVDDLLVTFNYTCLGGPTHFRYGIDSPSVWNDWQAVVSGQQPSGYLLMVGCEQTVYFQVKNQYGESNVVSDSIKTSTYRTARTISIVEALKYARPQGFTDGVIWADCEGCATTITFPDGGYQFHLGYVLNPARNMTRGMKADFELFGGGKLLKPGWEFVSFGMPEFAAVGNPDAPEAHGARISHQPAPGGRDIRLQVRLWRNILSEVVLFDVRTITLKGPCTEDISEAFKQQ